MIRVRSNARFKVRDLAKYLDQKKIGNRMLFGGNLTRQPVFVQLRKERPGSFRRIGETEGADEIMNQGLFLGTYPGLTKQMLEYEISAITDFALQR